MTSFERLDPLVQHHVVNTLGWRDLRPLQEASIEPVLRGDHCLVLAPTAGGKTEAAMFPLLSRICSERWLPPSVLYLSPLKALLNNLGERLDIYTRMIGRRAAVWHGDVGHSNRREVRVDPPDVLLTTPESLEAMLVSTNATMREQMKALRAVVVDEIHAFAGDDRGWHLVSVLERLNWNAGHELQRIGLTATVGNPEALLEWLAPRSRICRTVVQSPAEQAGTADVLLDYVGSLENAATVISRLHRGEKRLVFCDSRSRVESLAGLLRDRGVKSFVSHSSLSAAERRRAEEAFARGEDCVIVATSSLELGIDVGDLDRVIQIDAPSRVASFLQRLGRTGRRTGKARNCLFLATSDNALLQAAGLLNLWREGYVEPIIPPPLPCHIVAQQALALCLQYAGLVKSDLLQKLAFMPPSRAIEDAGACELILEHLVEHRWLETDGTRYFIGESGEQDFGRRHFLELLSVFTSAPLLNVTDGRTELGTVDESLFRGSQADGKVIALAGRGWRVQSVDWKERRVHVEPSETAGKTSWFGISRGLSMILCRAIRTVLASHDTSPLWSERARNHLLELRNEYAFLQTDGTSLIRRGRENICWFTFAGEQANSALASALGRRGVQTERVDDFAISFVAEVRRGDVEEALASLTGLDVLSLGNSMSDFDKDLKFAECVPPSLLMKVRTARGCAPDEVTSVLAETRTYAEVSA